MYSCKMRALLNFLAQILDWVLPAGKWGVGIVLTLTLMGGIGAVVFVKAKAHSYLFDDPEVCINCHIMLPQYTTWKHSSHAQVATCNDCHVPQDNIFNSYYFKAKDGSRHSALFTFRMENHAIQAIDASKNVIQNNCVRCHEHLNAEVATNVNLAQVHHGQGKLCWECHREVPHSTVRSLSSVPYSKMQVEPNKLPTWLTKHLNTIN